MRQLHVFSLLSEIVQYLSQFPQSLSPMANPIFFFKGELGHGLSILRKDEKRVISKTFLPDFLESNLSQTGPICDRFPSILGYDRDHASKSRSPLRNRNSLHLSEKLSIIFFMGSPLSSIPGRIDPGQSS